MSEELEVDELLLAEKDDIIDNNQSQPNSTFKGDKAEEKQLLKAMGFEEDLINTIYNNMNPIDLQEALDYLNKNEKGKFTHSFLINQNNVCTICGKGRYEHESDTLFLEDNNNELNDDENNDFIDDLLGYRNNNSNSHRFRAFENSYRNSRNSLEKNKKNDTIKLNDKECLICFENIENPNKVYLKCGHYFCIGCWTDYLKEKISNANVAKIHCMQHGCDTILETTFIKKILEGNDELIEKYDKFYQRKKMLEQNDKIKLCPFPDCEGYAEKKGKSKYVKCNFGHEFCFECGNAPHGKKKCEDMIDKDFEEWRSHKIVKRCPCCRMWTEKNEGCNHMTCVECRFQWCWLCQEPYDGDHFSTGSCKGLQFYKETDEKKIKAKLEENRKKYPPPLKIKIYLLNFLKCVGYLFLFVFVYLFKKVDNYSRAKDFPCAVYVFIALAYYPIFVCFELLFIVCVIIGTIPFLIYPPYFRKLKFYIVYRLFQC